MAKVGTGQTIYDMILSLNNTNTPVTGATFGIDVYRNGAMESGVTVSMSLTDADTGTFTSSWSADTVGDYQVVYRNLSTTIYFVTETYQMVNPDQLVPTVYIGL